VELSALTIAWYCSRGQRQTIAKVDPTGPSSVRDDKRGPWRRWMTTSDAIARIGSLEQDSAGSQTTVQHVAHHRPLPANSRRYRFGGIWPAQGL